MKKLLFISLFVMTLAVNAQITLKYPFGSADFSKLTMDNDTVTATINNSLTFLTASDTLVGNTYIYATIGGKVKAGDEFFFKTLNSATARTLVFKSTYFTCPSITTTASKTKIYRFIYDGTKFLYQGVTQID